MANPCIEYLVRKQINKQMFSAPCSVYVQDESGSKKIVLTVHPISGSFLYLVRNWRLSDTKEDDILPPFDESRKTKEELLQNNNFPEGYKISCEGIAIPQPGMGYPQEEQIYNHYFDNFLLSDKHFHKREEWLWKSFITTFANKLNIPFSDFDSVVARFNKIRTMETQQRWVVFERRRYWQYWDLWKLHLLTYGINPSGNFLLQEMKDFTSSSSSAA